MSHKYEVVLVEPDRGPRTLTPYVLNLSFRSVENGGFAGGTFDHNREIDAPDYERDSEVFFYKGSNGKQVGGGVILDPGRNITDAGSAWNVEVIGKGPAHTRARHVPYCIIDTRLDAWTAGKTTNARLSWAQGGEPGVCGGELWVLTIDRGTDGPRDRSVRRSAGPPVRPTPPPR